MLILGKDRGIFGREKMAHETWKEEEGGGSKYMFGDTDNCSVVIDFTVFI